MCSGFAVGHLVEFTGAPGIGRVGVIDGDMLRVDFFESVAEEVVHSEHVPAKGCWRARLEPETRVYWREPSTGEWLAGRVTGERLPDYFIQVPNKKWNERASEHDLRVRWDRPVHDPLQVLTSGGNESGYFRDARLPFLRNLVAQRAACANMAALLSSAAEIFPHQVHAAITVLSDPVQRYLIADEVGLGKTIEAGFVIRQTLLDDPQARITVVAPEPLRGQWDKELRNKFFTDDFPSARIVITSHETPEKWPEYHDSALVVVDEAHALAHDADENLTPYRELAALAHSAPKLLLLSATPVTSRYTTHLGLLHLLEPDLYRWDDREAFEHRYALRAELADSVYALDATFTFLLRSTLDDIRRLLPDDPRFEHLADQIVECLAEDDDLRDGVEPDDLSLRVEELRGHISETYRLHRRVIRHRRDQVEKPEDEAEESEPYAVRGRELSDVLTLPSTFDAVESALTEWRTGVSDHLLNAGLEDETTAYARILSVITSRAGGPFDDFVDALCWRVHGDAQAAQRAGLTPQEQAMLAAPTLIPAEKEALLELERHLNEAEDNQPLKATANALIPTLNRGGRIVVFCGPGVLAHQLAKHLRALSRTAYVAEHTRQVGAAASEDAVTEWRRAPRTSVLVADDTAEDGLNLQVASAVVHVRLPWNPNQFEQRIGRVDRYRSAESVSQLDAASQYVVSASPEHEALGTAWLNLLRDGYNIFSKSVSTLQDAIAEGLEAVWADALRDGPTGLASARQRVQDQLLEARQQIEKMDMLEAIYLDADGRDDVAKALRELELDWKGIQGVVFRYTSGGSGGINIRHSEHTIGKTVFDLVGSRPHVSPRLYTVQTMALAPAMAKGTFNRSRALRSPGTRVFRIGNPFIDTLAALSTIDERGQATAFRRVDPGHTGDPEPYFGFDFLVEADISVATERVTNPDEVKRALQRQADLLFPPFTRRVWVRAGSTEALTLSTALEWLNSPYDQRKCQNFNNQQIRNLVDIFGGWPEFQHAAETAEKVARSDLFRVTGLTTLCAEAQQRARRRLAVTRSQAEARRAAGRLLHDTESQLADVKTVGLLIDSLTQPNVRLMSATCVVRSGRKGAQGGA
ncbi:restriction endonuclease subunit R [Streptomyces sp. ET3-23]|uniref:protein DpdE n=1 Tax=Streptomyces sp. ET3-23 TaxID=2885643 RepID=UPI001D1295DA|nr:protein DpdE [Streptomyces sp. ET3-23]MCC2280251.1 restriction endonuclease subunit R [Streptomyces sp. ET3-23]